MNSIHIHTCVAVIGVLLGVVIGYTTGYATEIALVTMMCALVQGGIYLVERKRTEYQSAFGSFSLPLAMVLFCLGVCSGIVRVQFVTDRVPYVCESACTFEVRVVTASEIKNEYQVFSVRPTIVEVPTYDIQIRVPLYPEYEIGEILILSGKVTEPKVILPHEGDSFFDYRAHLHTKDVGSEMFYPSVERCTTTILTFTEKLVRVKNSFVESIQMYVAAPASSLASGMLFGASDFSKELTETFRVAGLSHIVVLSGFNIAIVISATLIVLSFLPLVLRLLLATLAVGIFVVMVGGEPSVVRATLMSLVSLLAMFFGRQYVARQALILSLLVIVMYEPLLVLHGVSLHLSFLATAGIVYGNEIVSRVFTRVPFRTLREILTTTTSAYIATLPYILYTFGSASLYGFFANIIVLPFVPLAMLLSFCVVVSALFSTTLAALFGAATSVLVSGILLVARTIEAAPYASVSYTISFSWMCFLYGGMSVLVLCLHHRYINETMVTKEQKEKEGIFSF